MCVRNDECFTNFNHATQFANVCAELASDSAVSDPAHARRLARASWRVSIAGILIGVFIIILAAALGGSEEYVYKEPLYDGSPTTASCKFTRWTDVALDTEDRCQIPKCGVACCRDT